MTKQINEENIRLAAYYIWEQAGRPQGQEKEHWIQACEQLFASKSNKKAAASRSNAKKPALKSAVKPVAKTAAKPVLKAKSTKAKMTNKVTAMPLSALNLTRENTFKNKKVLG